MKISNKNEQPNDLEGILHNCFGCGKVFRKNPISTGVDTDGSKVYDNVTKKGWEAYDNLVAVVYALEIMGVISNANNIVEELDDIIGEKGYYIV